MSLLNHEPASREYVLGRLDREHIADLADQAQSCLRELGRAVELCYMPGDATWYSITIAPMWHVIGAPGGGHVDRMPDTPVIHEAHRTRPKRHHRIVRRGCDGSGHAGCWRTRPPGASRNLPRRGQR